MTTLKICTGRSCAAHGSAYFLDRAKAEQASNSTLKLELCGCLGQCEKAPTVAVETSRKKEIFSHMSAPKVGQLVQKLNKPVS